MLKCHIGLLHSYILNSNDLLTVPRLSYLLILGPYQVKCHSVYCFVHQYFVSSLSHIQFVSV